MTEVKRIWLLLIAFSSLLAINLTAHAQNQQVDPSSLFTNHQVAFDGTSNNPPYALATTDPRLCLGMQGTIEIWIQVTTPPPAQDQYVLSHVDAAGKVNFGVVLTSDLKQLKLVFSDSASDPVVAGCDLTDKKWHHFQFSVNGSHSKAYMDGIPGPEAVASFQKVPVGKLILGGKTETIGPDSFVGNLGCVRFFGRALPGPVVGRPSFSTLRAELGPAKLNLDLPTAGQPTDPVTYLRKYVDFYMNTDTALKQKPGKTTHSTIHFTSWTSGSYGSAPYSALSAIPPASSAKEEWVFARQPDFLSVGNCFVQQLDQSIGSVVVEFIGGGSAYDDVSPLGNYAYSAQVPSLLPLPSSVDARSVASAYGDALQKVLSNNDWSAIAAYRASVLGFEDSGAEPNGQGIVPWYKDKGLGANTSPGWGVSRFGLQNKASITGVYGTSNNGVITSLGFVSGETLLPLTVCAKGNDGHLPFAIDLPNGGKFAGLLMRRNPTTGALLAVSLAFSHAVPDPNLNNPQLQRKASARSQAVALTSDVIGWGTVRDNLGKPVLDGNGAPETYPAHSRARYTNRDLPQPGMQPSSDSNPTEFKYGESPPVYRFAYDANTKELVLTVDRFNEPPMIRYEFDVKIGLNEMAIRKLTDLIVAELGPRAYWVSFGFGQNINGSAQFSSYYQILGGKPLPGVPSSALPNSVFNTAYGKDGYIKFINEQTPITIYFDVPPTFAPNFDKTLQGLNWALSMSLNLPRKTQLPTGIESERFKFTSAFTWTSAAGNTVTITPSQSSVTNCSYSYTPDAPFNVMQVILLRDVNAKTGGPITLVRPDYCQHGEGAADPNGKQQIAGTFTANLPPTYYQLILKGFNPLVMNPETLQVMYSSKVGNIQTNSIGNYVFLQPNQVMAQYDIKYGIAVPWGINYAPIETASNAERTVISKCGYDYARNASLSVGGSIGFPGLGSASTNVDVSNSYSTSNSSESVTTTSNFQVRSFVLSLDRAMLRLDTSPDTGAGFADQVLALAAQMKLGKTPDFNTFFATYGTHYPNAALYGGTAYLDMTMSQQDYTSKSGTTVGVKSSVSASVPGLISGSVDVAAKLGIESGKNGMSSDSKTRWTSSGGIASSGNSLSVPKGSEVPIALDLRPNYQLLSPAFFDDPFIWTTLQPAMRQAFFDFIHQQVTAAQPSWIFNPSPPASWYDPSK